jgi:glucosamine--fructose-6-phosphate aminotransferase (isomerizing)
MCGIVGYLGESCFTDYILSGLTLLQNRGYDSVGVSYISEDNSIKTIKFASTNTYDSLETLKIETLANKIDDASVAIGHTRWATHGAKTDINAHPHHDVLNRISLVHNGIIENYHELKTNLLTQGYSFKSQTDTEVISILIGKYLDDGLNIKEAIKCTIAELSGTWALVIIHRDFPDKIWATRNGSPLLLGMDDDFVMFASEQIAFANYIKKYIVLNNHDLIEVSKTDGKISYSKNIHRYTLNEKAQVAIELLPTGYTHWMLKEIEEQPDSIYRAMNNGGRLESNNNVKLGGLDSNRELLLKIDHLILLGCGTSYHAGLWSLDIFKTFDIFTTVAIYDGAEFSNKDIPKSGITGLVLLSQSGETKDLHRCIQIAKEYNMITIGVVNVIDSFIAREVDCGVYINAGREVSVASTKSFTNQCVVLSLIACWFSQNRETAYEYRSRLITDLRNLPIQMQRVIENKARIEEIVESIFGARSMFLLAKGKDEAIAKEGALKLKEIAYIHAEGYSSSALKHGPFALIVEDLPIIIFDIGQENREKNNNAYQEVLARGAKIIRISDMDYGDLIVESNGNFGGVLANIYVQLISYFLAVKVGYNPDFPRNLAKVVTVE